MDPQGWYRDPYGSHDDRWFSGGRPTSLVRDQGAESYDEPPQDRLPPYPRERSAGEQLPPARAGTESQSWTVWLPGLLTLAGWCFFFWQTPFFIIVAMPVIALLVAGLRIPGWRPAIAITLWMAFALSCICIPLLLDAIAQALNGWNLTAGAGMQFIESSIVGLRSAVITLTHRATPLRFILFPMVHVAEQAFYDEVAARARLCQLIVAEGIPSEGVPAQSWMARHHWGHLVDQIAGLRLESLGVPVRWEAEPPAGPRSTAQWFTSRTADIAGAATIGLARMFFNPQTLPSLDQAEVYDESAENLTGSWLDRLVEYNLRTVRDARLMRVLDEIHRDRAAEPVKVGVVFGAGHMPAVTNHLCGQHGYIATDAEWLTVIQGRSLARSGHPRTCPDSQPGQHAC